jgi:uncharacterized protein involved in exopolysaccharide biosynthesis
MPEDYHKNGSNRDNEKKNGYNPGNSLFVLDEGAYDNQYKGDPDEIDLKKLLAMVWRRKWTVIGLTLLGVVLTAYYAFSLIPVYQSQGTILITESQQRVHSSSDLQNLLASSYGFGLGSRIANELYVLHSRQLSLNLADRMLEEQNMENGHLFPLLYTEFPADPTIASRGAIASRIRNSLKAERGERESDLIFISFRSYSPYEAKWVVDQAIDGYRELSTEQNRMAANAALAFLDEERKRIEAKLTESEQNLRDFMQNTGLVQIDSQTGRVIDRISDLETHRQEIQTRLVAVESAMITYERQLDKIRPGLADRYAESVAPTLERYQFRLAELETERLLYITRNPSLRQNPEHEPELVQINDQIYMLKQEINQLASRIMGEEGDEFLSFLTSSDGNIASRITELRNHLIEGRGVRIPPPLSLFGARQPAHDAGLVNGGNGRLHVDPLQNEQAVEHWGQWSEDRSEGEVGFRTAGPVAIQDRAARGVHRNETARVSHRLGQGWSRGSHRFEPRQCDGDAPRAPQERPAAESKGSHQGASSVEGRYKKSSVCVSSTSSVGMS